MFGTLFQFRMAFRMSAFVRLFCGAARCTRLRISSGPFCLQANTSPGAAPGSTTRFLLSAVNVIVGLSHIAITQSKRGRVQARSRCETFQVRFASRFGKLSAGAKSDGSAQSYRRLPAGSQAFPRTSCAGRFVFSRSLVWTLQRTQQ